MSSPKDASVLTFRVNWLFTKRLLYVMFEESTVLFLFSTGLKKFGESKVFPVCCLLPDGYSGDNTDLCSVHEEAGID